MLKAPFPWFGGKSRAAELVWRGFGSVANYVEPFFGSGAVLISRPEEHFALKTPIETVNDIDCYLANFWRAVKWAPEEVAEHADWPVNEADLHARHRWLVNQTEFRERMRREPKFFDAQIAGWWVWGICQWIGSGWCSAPEWTGRVNAGRRSRGVQTAQHAQRPDLTASRGVLSSPSAEWKQIPVLSAQQGAHSVEHEKRPHLWRGGNGVHGTQIGTRFDNTRPHLGPERGVQKRARNLSGAADWEKRPELGNGGRGGHRDRQQMPMLRGDAGAAGAGIHASALHRKMPKADRGTASRLQPVAERDVRELLPDISGDGGATGRGLLGSGESRGPIVEWMQRLAFRFRRVRVCCGDWKRILGRSCTEKIGVTGVFFDPPYGAGAGRDPSLYTHDDLNVAALVRAWAVEHGSNPKLRIAYCSYGEEQCPKGWERVHWKAVGGYAASAGHTENSERETIDFSPACELVERQLQMFAAEGR